MRRVSVRLSGALVAALAVSLLPASGAAAEPPPPDVAVRESHQVTLVTGDVVLVDVLADGRTSAAVVQGGSSPAFRIYERGGHTHVVPVTAQPYLAAGVLDPRLFDVTSLVAQGFDDASTPSLPLIVRYRGGLAAARTATAPAVSDWPAPPAVSDLPAPPAASRTAAELTSIGGRAVAVDKTGAGAFWADVSGADSSGAGASSGQRPAGPAGLDDGIEKIWLDGRVGALLDRSVPHVGAPRSWQLGYDGRGVKVAVLDTGVNADHPDLAGKVAQARSFTPDGTTADRAGHGTHVASTVAGTGAASGGRYQGVAPGAELLVGKVLGDDGFGLDSWIIAGMEWAVAAGARVVNLSLGGDPTDGTDPMSLAVDELSEASGALFVIAAGNSGPSARTVSSPAAAGSALAVGNAQLDGNLNFTSSRGPRLGDNGIKPELVAPGTDIVAADLAAGYHSMSGTSMAAPHVAGAAAILAQQHDSWAAPQLKAGLVSSTVPLQTASVWEQGAGRLAVDRAVEQTVHVSHGTLDLGYLDLDTPDGGLIRTSTLTYRNDGAEPANLQLSLQLTGDDGAAAPAGTVTVSPSSLTLAPGNSAEVTVRLDATSVPAGQYAGRLEATGGPHPVTTALGFYRQGELVDVTISLTDRRGQPAGGHVSLLNYHLGVFDPNGYFDVVLAPGQQRTLRIPRASYSISATVSTFDESGRFLSEISLVSQPQRMLDRNAEIVLDARTARPIEVETPRDAVPEVTVLGWTRGAGEGNDLVESVLVLPAAGQVERLSATPTEPVTDGRYSVHTIYHLAMPWLSVSAGGQRFLPTYLTAAPRYVGQGQFEIVDAGTWPAGHDLSGRIALLREDPTVAPAEQARAAAAAGAAMVLITPAQPGILRGVGFGVPIPAATVPYADGERLRDRLRHGGRAQVSGVIDSPYSYDLAFHDQGRVPPAMRREVRHQDLAQIDAGYHGDGTARQGLLSRYPTAPCRCSLIRIVEAHPLPYERTEYVSAGEVVWTAIVQGGLTSNLRADGLRYQAGQRYRESWGAAPLAPRPATREPSVRDGDTMHLRVSPIADAGGHHGNSAGPSEGVLYREGTELARLFGGSGDVTVPAEPANYRLHVDTSNGEASNGRLSTATSTLWTFRSARADQPATLPLLSVDYRLPLSDSNAVDPRRPVLVELAASYPDRTPARPASVRLWVSYDDGAQWQPVRTAIRHDGTAVSLLPAAGQGGYASLRVELTDRDGNRMEQTIIRSHRLVA